jgi:hypothetical protein
MLYIEVHSSLLWVYADLDRVVHSPEGRQTISVMLSCEIHKDSCLFMGTSIFNNRTAEGLIVKAPIREDEREKQVTVRMEANHGIWLGA